MLGLKDYRSWVVFISYIAFSISQALLVTATKDKKNKYNYNPTTVVLLVECLKLTMSIILCLCNNNSIGTMLSTISSNLKILFLYFIPAFLYCIYNNLAFINLAAYDPTSYTILQQLRIVISGIIFQMLFQRKLTKVQWLSMILLTLSCVMKELDHKQVRILSFNLFLSPSIFFILLQVLCSCFAGVYTEYLLKGYTSCGTVDLWIQNIFMYANSILCNVIFLLLSGTFGSAFGTESIKSVLQFKVIVLTCNNAALGLVTSVFLKNLNSILKNFACALELMLTAVLSWVFFGIPITILGMLSTSSVMFAIQLYSRNPVIVQSVKPVAKTPSKRFTPE